MNDIILELKRKLEKAFEKNKTSCLLFSGGLDTSILVSLNPKIKAITVSLESFGDDIRYAKRLARDLKLEHIHRIIKIDEAIDSIPIVIKTLKTFTIFYWRIIKRRKFYVVRHLYISCNDRFISTFL